MSAALSERPELETRLATRPGRSESAYACACGCGEEINPRLRVIDEMVERGLSNRQIALRLQVSPAYIRQNLRETTPERQGRPRFVMGHSARVYWASEQSTKDVALRRGKRQRQQIIKDALDGCSKPVGVARSRMVLAHWRYLDTRCRPCRLATREKAKRQYQAARSAYDSVLRDSKASRRAEIDRLLRMDAKDREAERVRLRNERALERWRVWVVTQQRREMRARDRLRHDEEKRQRRGDRDQRRGEGLLVSWHLSLDAPLRGVGREGEDLSDRHGSARSHDLLIGEDAADTVARNETADTLRRIVGDIGPEEVSRMGEAELARVREKLLAEGIRPGLVTDSERERLREPNRHAGASVPKMGRSHGGKRTRAQQQQVTTDHRVREMTGAGKKQHAALRRVRKSGPVA